MLFKTHLPGDILKPYVESLGIQESNRETIHKVLPGTSLVIGFQYKGAVSTYIDSQESRLSPYGLTGMPDQFRLFKNAADTGTVLIFFKAGGAAQFFREPLHEFAGQSISLDNFIPGSELSLMQEQLQEIGTDAGRIRLMEQFLVSRIYSDSKDKLVLEAIRRIQLSKGDVNMRELTKQLYISKSAFEKRFRKIVGTSPKKFASLVRFKDILANYQPYKSLTEIAHEAGFYDQSHFIKQFKTYTGETPENFFKTGR